MYDRSVSNKWRIFERCCLKWNWRWLACENQIQACYSILSCAHFSRFELCQQDVKTWSENHDKQFFFTWSVVETCSLSYRNDWDSEILISEAQIFQLLSQACQQLLLVFRVSDVWQLCFQFNSSHKSFSNSLCCSDWHL